jgi:DNA-binding IclR family transcriptional regulator
MLKCNAISPDHGLLRRLFRYATFATATLQASKLINSDRMVQSLERALSILQHLGSAGQDGLRLLDLQQKTSLARPTAHRLLATLVERGFVVRGTDSHRYFLGPELAVLGWSVLSRLDLRKVCEPEIQVVAQETGDTAFLTVRSGYDTVCIDRKMGPYPIRAFTVDVGSRRPLGVGAGGVALLASLDESETEEICSAIAPRLETYSNVTLATVKDAVAACRRNGYAVSDGLVMQGIRGLALTVRDPKGWPVAAVSIAAVRERINARRLPSLVEALQRHCRAIERSLARQHEGGR